MSKGDTSCGDANCEDRTGSVPRGVRRMNMPWWNRSIIKGLQV